MQQEWTHSFFGGGFYREAFTATEVFKRRNPELEIEQVLQLINAQSGSHILDWCGGWGRHAIPIAKRGYHVTLLDFCEEYINLARAEAEKQGVSIETVVADFRNTPPEIQADYAVNLFTAGISYLGKENDLVALRSLFAALRPGGLFLIHTMGLPWTLRNFSPTNCWNISKDETKWLLEKRSFDFTCNTATTKFTYLDTAAGTCRAETIRQRIYSPAEFIEMLALVGFGEMRLYSDFAGAEFNIESKRIVLVGRKP